MNISDFKIAFASKKLSALTAKQSVENSRRIGIILDSEEKQIVSHFESLRPDLEVEPEDFRILICGKKHAKNTLFDYPVFGLKDIDLSGNIRNEEVSGFLDQQFDVLISFTSPKNKLATLLVSVARARLKVGRMEKGYNADLYDFVISAEENEAGIFTRELKKYLKIINKTTV